MLRLACRLTSFFFLQKTERQNAFTRLYEMEQGMDEELEVFLVLGPGLNKDLLVFLKHPHLPFNVPAW